MAAKLPNLRLLTDNVAGLKARLRELTRDEVLVGFPEDPTEREDENGNPVEITNAALGYIHDHGDPEHNIPQREFMKPGMEEVKPRVSTMMATTARAAVTSKDPSAVTKGFTAVGTVVMVALKKKINEGVPPPLAESTLKDRVRRGRKGAKKELASRAAGNAPGTQLAKPLVDTAQMRNAVNFVIRRKRRW